MRIPQECDDSKPSFFNTDDAISSCFQSCASVMRPLNTTADSANEVSWSNPHVLLDEEELTRGSEVQHTYKFFLLIKPDEYLCTLGY